MATCLSHFQDVAEGKDLKTRLTKLIKLILKGPNINNITQDGQELCSATGSETESDY